MHRRIQSSRRRFEKYLSDVVRRRQADEETIDSSIPGGRKKSGRRLRSTTALIRRFWELLEGQRRAIAFALGTLTVATLLALIPPAATKFVIDYILGEKPLPESVSQWIDLPSDRWHLLLYVVLGVLAISFVRVGIHLWGRWFATRATKRIQLSVRKKVFEHAVRLPLHRVQELKSGGLASVLREDGGSVGELVFGMLYNPWRAVIQLLGSLCVLAWVDWRLLAGALFLVPVIFLTHRTWIRRIRPQYRSVRNQRQSIDAQATEAFGGIRVVRGFSGQRAEALRFLRGNNLLARQELHVWWWTRVVEVLWELAIPLGSAALLMYGGWQVLQGNLTLGDVMMFLVYLLMLLEPMAVLAESATAFQNSLSGLDRILDLLDEPREMAASPDAITVQKEEVAGRITFENVSFHYPGVEAAALRNINLNVVPGQTIALVGASGAGKTTLCNLVARFYDPTTGRILLDGRDLRDIEVESYRGLLGIVEQDVFLFDGTVAENIGYASRNATEAEILRAAQIANADGFIRALPNGYETFIGERGVKLSGGQRQRIAIARAVLADPRILILDEATSNLDTESERLIQRSLHALIQGRTCFVIAHRLSTITHADQIVVLEHGTIREVGTHEELMEADGRYRAMVEAQINLHTAMSAPSEELV